MSLYGFKEEFTVMAKKWSDGTKLPNKPGIYAIFLKDIRALPEYWQPILGRDDKMLYVGKAATGLSERLHKHFAGRDSTKDTFRRSIGAVLLSQLKLKPILRVSATNKSQYSFKNEDVLTEWIRENCLYTYFLAAKGKTASMERSMIREKKPPLNIQNNPKKISEVEQAREECRRRVGFEFDETIISILLLFFIIISGCVLYFSYV
jgi:hypothetical protein